jgi:phosphotriesterase-related protein
LYYDGGIQCAVGGLFFKEEGIMNRRDFLKMGTALAGGTVLGTEIAPAQTGGRVMTVTGEISVAEMGATLPHEHVMSTFGSDPAERASYDTDGVLGIVLPYLRGLRELGCRTLVDCTAAYFGRDAALLRKISETSGLRILTNTGYYGAANHRYVPAHAFWETAGQLAERWLTEWRHGIDGTGIRPGFIKLGFNAGPLAEIDRKLLQAAAQVHRVSGLTLAAHTGDNAASAHEQLRLLREEGVSASAWIWVHANSVKDSKALRAAAEQGAWLEFDGISPETTERHLELVRMMKGWGRLGQTLLSHDGDSYRDGKLSKPYDALFRAFIPALRQAGFNKQEVRLLTVENPRRAFAVAPRLSGIGR